MPLTYSLIRKTTLTTTASTVDFSNIPNTYTDLIVRFSARMDQSAVSSAVYVIFNNDNTLLYSFTNLVGNGSTATSTRGSDAAAKLGNATSTNATASTFSNGELYIPNYLISQNRQVSSYQVAETNAVAVPLTLSANLYRSNTAVSRITFFGDNNFVAGSSFSIYGVKSS